MSTPGDRIPSSEITPEETFINRRRFMKASVWAGSTLATTGLYKAFSVRPPLKGADTGKAIATTASADMDFHLPADEKPNTLSEISGYNNYYEFSTDKSSVARKARNFVTSPWEVRVGGLVNKPKTFGLEELLKFEQEERVYRFRCVEGWSMVIPWVGFPLSKLLAMVEPKSEAKYVAFETYYDVSQMPDSGSAGIDLPYVEGLRLDEAMHPLTLLATGLYGKTLPNQNGAPIRLVVPWKYGFKSIKSIVRISLASSMPPTTWNIANPSEYGFYSNVNPEVRHPRWSQADEQRIGELSRRKTLKFNGYEAQVASLYAGMDLRKNY